MKANGKTWRNKKHRPHGATADSVVIAFDANKKLSSTQLGAMLGLHPAYVRKALSRNGRKLARSNAR